MTTDLLNNKWEIEVYSKEPVAITKVDVMRPLWRSGEKIRWSYNIMIEVYKSEKGVNHAGDRACGFADAAVISDPPQVNKEYKLIEIGDVVETPFGSYKVEWLRQGSINTDHLKLTEVN